MKNSEINKLRQSRNLAFRKYKAFNLDQYPDYEDNNQPCIFCSEFINGCKDMTYKHKLFSINAHIAFAGDYALI